MEQRHGGKIQPFQCYKRQGIVFQPSVRVGEWTEECEYIEQQAKEEADILLFVINGQTRGVASLAEVAYAIALKRSLVLVLSDIEEGRDIEGNIISAAECRDINRGRFYVQSMAEMHLIPVFETVEAAVQYIINVHCTPIPLPAWQDIEP